MQHNPFNDHWRECLRAHYRHVITVNDTQNEQSLHQVLLNIGVSEDDLASIRAEALRSPESETIVPSDQEEGMPTYHVDPEAEREALARLESQLVSMVETPATAPLQEQEELPSPPLIELPDLLGMIVEPSILDSAPEPDLEEASPELDAPPDEPEPPALTQLSLF